MNDHEEIIGTTSMEVAEIIESHQEHLGTDTRMCDIIHLTRRSVEFFMARGENSRAMIEVVRLKGQLMEYLNLKP